MRRGLTLLTLTAAMALGAALYHVSYATLALERELARLDRRLIETEEAHHLLRAEWSYLNAPARIEALARRHLGFQPLLGEQVVALDQLPLARPADAVAMVEAIRPKAKPALPAARAVPATTPQLAAASDGQATRPSVTAALAAVIDELTR